MKPAAVHPVTLAALAVIAYSATNLVHEGLGHGGACVLVGAKPRLLEAILFQCDDSMVGAAAWRWISAGGVVANALAAGLGMLALRRWRSPPTPARYLLWLFTALNVLVPCGYLLFSGLLGMGDGEGVTRGLEPAWIYRGGMALAGAFLYFLIAPRWIVPEFRRFLGVGADEHKLRTRRLSLLPYAVGGLLFVAAGLFNPEGRSLVLTSAAAASFGGTCLLTLLPQYVERMPADAGEPAQAFPPHRGWWLAGLLVLVFFVAVLGPGIRLSSTAGH